MSEEDKAAVRTIALEVINDYRDRGCPEPDPIGPKLLQEMMPGPTARFRARGEPLNYTGRAAGRRGP
jgi:hypothetical protein